MYSANNSKERNSVIMHHMPVIKKIAKSMHSKYWRHFDYEELINIGVLGLIEAMGTFREEKNCDFGKFCTCRIKGKILDKCRKQDWVPRRTRKLFQNYKNVQDQLYSDYKRKPTFNEIQLHMNLNNKESRLLKVHNSPHEKVSLSVITSEKNDQNKNYQFEDRKSNKPYENLQRQECKNFIIKELEKTEKFVIELYYYQDMSMKEIAETLGITESRISQIHTKAIKKLRVRFQSRQHLKEAV